MTSQNSKLLKEILKQANKEKWAVGHFNAANLEQFKAITSAAQELKAPVIIGTSQGERNWWGLENIIALVKRFQEDGQGVYLNADHTKSAAEAKQAIEFGYDAIHFDGSLLSLEDNISQTRELVAYARAINLNISLEGELGSIKGESQLTQEKIELKPEDFTDPLVAKKFVESTGVDCLAIAIGNIHGINPGEPKLDFDRLEQIRQAVPHNVVLVLHAASGIIDEDIKRAIRAGIANIHISTELRVVFRHNLEESLKANPNEYSPYKLDEEAVKEMETLVKAKIKLFGSENKLSS